MTKTIFLWSVFFIFLLSHFFIICFSDSLNMFFIYFWKQSNLFLYFDWLIFEKTKKKTASPWFWPKSWRRLSLSFTFFVYCWKKIIFLHLFLIKKKTRQWPKTWRRCLGSWIFSFLFFFWKFWFFFIYSKKNKAVAKDMETLSWVLNFFIPFF